MKYTSALILFTVLLNQLFSQAQSARISRADSGASIALLGPVGRSFCDQFAGISVKATTTRSSPRLFLLVILCSRRGM